MATLSELMVKVGADISDFQRKMSQVGSGVQSIGKQMTGLADKMNPLVTTIAGLSPAILSMGGALTSASIGFAGFGAVAVGVLGDVFEASTELEKINEKMLQAEDADEIAELMKEREFVLSQLSETQRQAVKDLDNFKTSWGNFTKEFEKPIGQAFGTTLHITMKALEDFKPAIMGITEYVNEFLLTMNKKMESQSFQDFVGFVNSQAVPTFDKLMTISQNLIGTIANLFRGFSHEGQGTLDFLVNFTQKIEDMTARFASLPASTRSAILTIGALGTVFVPLLAVLGLVAQGVGALVTVVGAIISPVGLAVAAIALLGVAFYKAYKEFEPFRTGVNRIFDAVKEKVTTALSAVVSFVREKLAQIKEFWDDNGSQILEAVRNVWGFISPIIEKAMGISQMIIQYAWNAIKGIIDGALDVIMGLIKVFAGLFTGDFSKMWEGVKQLFSGAIKVIWNWMSLSFVGAIRGLIMKFVKQIGKFFVSLWDDIVLRFLYGKDKVLKLVDDLKAGATNAFNSMKTWIMNVVNSLRTGTVTTFTNMKNGLVTLFNNIKTTISTVWNNIKTTFFTAIGNIVSRVSTFKNELTTRFTQIKDSVVGKIKDTATEMKTKFTTGITDLVTQAKTIPKKIGDGITGAIGNVKSGVKALGDKIIDIFKETLGIHSPSKVFEKLGGFVIAGLKNGLTSENIKTFATKQFSKISDGALGAWSDVKSFFSGNTLSSIKSFFSAAGGSLKDFFTGSMNVAGSGVQRWRGIASQALMMTGQFSAHNLERLLYQMQTESGGNPQAINKWDINWQNGIPSKGLMQVIDPTFQAYKMPGFNNIWNPLDNILASIRYAVSRYGSLTKAYRGVGYAKGGVFKGTQTGSLVHMAEKGGDEAIIPLSRKRYMAPFASAIADHMESSTNGGQTVYQNNITLNATIREDADVDKIAKAIVREQTKLDRAGGKKK